MFGYTHLSSRNISSLVSVPAGENSRHIRCLAGQKQTVAEPKQAYTMPGEKRGNMKTEDSSVSRLWIRLTG